jgi:hypothetical protein
MFIGRIAPGEAQHGANILSGMIFCQTLLNKVAQSISGHVLEDLVFLDGSSVQLPETDCSTAARCNDCSGAAIFRNPYVVWPATRCVGWVLLAHPIDSVEIIA